MISSRKLFENSYLLNGEATRIIFRKEMIEEKQVSDNSLVSLYFQHVASNIVEHEIRHKEILQSSFDLLGELVKFNIEAFKTFDNIFTTQQKVSKQRVWSFIVCIAAPV